MGLLDVWNGYRDHGSGYGIIVIDSCIDKDHPALQTTTSNFLVEKIDQCLLTKPSREYYEDEDSFNNATHRFPHGTAISGIILGREGV
ncbi:MAG: S8 family serine peptidase [Rickettsiales bacterium]|nr:S8 family serine peptidase [Rickettsiales bacterium]